MSTTRSSNLNGNIPSIVFAGEIIVKPDSQLETRVIPEYELVYFPKRSHTRYLLGDQTYEVSAPGFIITRPGEQHAYFFDPLEATRHLFIHFTVQEQAALELELLRRAVWITSYNTLLPTLLRDIMNISYSEGFHWKVRCNRLLGVVLEELNAQLCQEEAHGQLSRPIRSPQLKAALQFIDENLNRNFRISEVASFTGWTQSHLSRVVKEYTGLSPSLFIMNKRIERACQLLLYGELTGIKEVAYAIGFDDEQYFCRCFRRVTGMSASEYRTAYGDARFQNLYPVDDRDTAYPLNQWFYFSGSNIRLMKTSQKGVDGEE
ncbi:AraC family transcriptional regulator [Alicyclobacillus fastidiosus]|uniref:AraC family transcriptional regulator n=1 Tax=Alicyclobacillus fastidiosus TaxID=392011 RepID=A0ABY6ZCC0_9BACL|nr:AraC family transcriptional regulator [Alicyclobacillus fastidiosus]WAH40487.1 AraC family transcriptional regulator [Alicyclobacillus fastidiosus]GMA61902.1 hypothetical protein GCM10025859_23420 [Alicyclobacillus fastidiosus]